MHVAFDIDGTITRCPEFFAVISKALVAAGHRVSIISYREDREFALEDLTECGIAFDELVLPTERELHHGTPQEWKSTAALWKASICRRLAVDVFFEDMPEVVNALDKATVAFMAIDPAAGKVSCGRMS